MTARDERPTVAVIGGGASGTLAAIHLLAVSTPVRVLLFEASATRLHRGIAYSTGDPLHLLNVQASHLSAYPQLPAHFVDWCRQQDVSITGDSYVSRARYGEYLDDTLRTAAYDAQWRSTLEIIRGRVESLSEGTDRVSLTLGDGRRFDTAAAVIATGYLKPRTPSGIDTSLEGYVADPWTHDLSRVHQGLTTLLIGTGLTAVDMGLSLATRGTRVTALSRHGLLPKAHRRTAAPTLPPQRPLASTAADLVRNVRRCVEDSSGDWRQVIDGMRPSVQKIWRSLTETEQRRLLRAERFWDIHRHRMAPAVAACVAELRTDQRFAVHPGSIVETRAGCAQIEAAIKGRDGAVRWHAFDSIVNCTGPSVDVRTSTDALHRALLSSGVARPGPHGLGFDAMPDGALIGARGAVSSRLFAIGPLLKGVLWETTAVPEIRSQAASVAALLTGSRAPNPLVTTEATR